MSNRSSDLGKKITSLYHLIYIPKIYYLRSANFALEFLSKEGSKAQKKIYTSCLKKGLESHLAFTASTASGTTNYHCSMRECLESHLPSNYCQDLRTQLYTNQRQSSRSHPAATTSSLFTNISNIPEVTPLPTKILAISHSLWHKHCYRLGIKDLTPASCSLCKYTWEIVFCIVLTGKKRLGPDKWPKTLQ